jgi:hypothetical protein
MGRQKKTDNLVSADLAASSTAEGGATSAALPVADVEKIPSYVVETSKSGRAMCKKCDERINNKELRIGVIIGSSFTFSIPALYQHVD